jgi:hypothetical protein
VFCSRSHVRSLEPSALGGHPVCGGVLESRGAAGPGILIKHDVVRDSGISQGCSNRAGPQALEAC